MKATRRRTPLSVRFAKFVLSGPPSTCWPWLGASNQFGYGQIRDGERARLATHVALEIDGRPRPDGALALHSCDNPICVNPNHLRWGTKRDNTLDMIERGQFRTPFIRQDRCVRGHDLGLTRHISRGGHSSCRECNTIRLRERRAHEHVR